MCNVCHVTNSVVSSYKNQYDPTKTTVLRSAFARKMRVCFTDIQRLINDALIDKDVFGAKLITQRAAYQNEFDFPTSGQKVDAFMNWIQTLIDDNVLQVTRRQQIGQAVNPRWTDLYIENSYKRGLLSARNELRKINKSIPSIEESGGVQTVMNTPFHLDRVGVLFIRVFEDLKGITQTMAMQISRVLSQGMIDGDNPRLIANKLVAVISEGGGDLGITDTIGRYIPAKRRAEILARTEVIRAHHKAMIQEYRNWGVEGITVRAELRTAGDNRVCDICSGLEGNTYSLEEAENLIPVHPLCRCMAIPYEVKN